MTDREKVENWLKKIGETDAACIAEVMQACKNDPEVRKYYVSRFEEIAA